ncbi:Ash family protein [Volucribacter psittacicida]|uniref:Ash family protein n=1 Tax=Volucribacter psittacicida TaxID=203482 RepID=A0A4R1G273_9PAST|nr:host cell division inhibitor Icd-like protein [Volucribacter psittacicida]TCK01678.1 Ash family protein [Volucribacter psittacicida]
MKPSNNTTIYTKKALQQNGFKAILFTQSKKTIAEPGNSNDKLVANSTPKACFFIRNFRSFKESDMQYCTSVFLSMVAYSGKGFALCCVPQVAVFQPVIRYRPQVWKLQAVTSLKLFTCGVNAMIYQFLGVSRQHYDPTQAEQIRILAESENQARAYLARNYVLILLGRLPNSAKNDRTLIISPCQTQQNNGKIAPHFEKESASREKLNIHKANSTPNKHRAFFVRDFRTPKENNRSNFGWVAYHSMMACSGQSLRLAGFPCVPVSHPATRYRQTVRSLAIAFEQFTQGLLAMKTFTKPTALLTPIALIQAVKGGIYA